jgi:hypothetical protein
MEDRNKGQHDLLNVRLGSQTDFEQRSRQFRFAPQTQTFVSAVSAQCQKAKGRLRSTSRITSAFH